MDYVVELLVEQEDENENTYVMSERLRFANLEGAHFAIMALRHAIANRGFIWKVTVPEGLEAAWAEIEKSLNPFCRVQKITTLKRVVEEVLPLPPR